MSCAMHRAGTGCLSASLYLTRNWTGKIRGQHTFCCIFRRNRSSASDFAYGL